jgi:hypothetical protein
MKASLHSSQNDSVRNHLSRTGALTDGKSAAECLPDAALLHFDRRSLSFPDFGCLIGLSGKESCARDKPDFPQLA